MKILVLGGTGAVGQYVVSQALSHPKVEKLIAPTRRPLKEHSKLINPLVDYEKLTGEEDWWQVDIVICCLGTTLKQAGSKEMFFRIDHDYVINSAKYALKNGCKRFVYNSSTGAGGNSSISFYLKTKTEIENHLKDLSFEQLTLARPSLLEADSRPDRRLGEELALSFNKVFGFLLPSSLKAVKVEKVASCLLHHALHSSDKFQILDAQSIQHFKGQK